MKVLQTIQGLSASSGGPSTCSHDLMTGLHSISPGTVELYTLKCKHPANHNLGEGAEWLKECNNDGFSPLVISHNFKKEIQTYDYDVYHVNALWSYSSHITCKIARKKGKPYLISPHGMLYPTALRIKQWKKIPMLWLWFNKDIHSATCIHATCQQEAEYVRAFGYKGPIAIIPNCVVFPEGISPQMREETSIYNIPSKKQIGFLGRLHPIKKVENVLYALSSISKDTRDGLIFQIMGKYDNQYEQWLKDEVVRQHLEDCVEFVGFVSGREKYERLSQLSALMVPSAQENFGMIVPEALICGTPVYASLGTPWSELNECKCGWWKDNSPETIARIILDILHKSEDELKAMGQRGYNLMAEKYEQHKVAQMMLTLYKWIVDGGKTPEFVITE
ncbi:MAG: glycosyltransferase [Bacteroides sp.]|nr:glycosyltransferase [Bacteroides sp.]MCM1447171.1 glycosyltransferase [Bacteroides sp.]